MEKKKTKTLVPISMLTLLLLTGTFAWSSISQNALNENDGKTESGGRIHDDYNKESGNKDIYAENYSTQNLMVRVKLSEYMEDNGVPKVAGTDRLDRTTWTPYTLPGTEESTIYRTYVEWELGGEKVYLPTFNKDNTNKEVAVSGDAIGYDSTGTAFDYSSLTDQSIYGDGSQDAFTVGDSVSDPSDPTDPLKNSVAKSTLTQERHPLLMSEWLALPRTSQQGDFWVIDEDGWAYWANILPPGESTSLLLNSLTWNQSTMADLEKWYYGIDVVGEFSSKSDVSQLATSDYGSPSSNGEKIIDVIFSSVSSLSIRSKEEDLPTISAGTSREFYAEVSYRASLDWSMTPENAGTIDSNGKLTVNEDTAAGTRITIQLTLGDQSTSKTLEVTRMDAKVGDVIQFNGENYIYAADLGNGNRMIVKQTSVATGLSEKEENDYLNSYYQTLSNQAKEEVQPVQNTFKTQSVSPNAAGFGPTSAFVSSLSYKDTTDLTKVTLGEQGVKKAFKLSLADLAFLQQPGNAFETTSKIKTSFPSVGLVRSRTANSDIEGSVYGFSGKNTTNPILPGSFLFK